MFSIIYIIFCSSLTMSGNKEEEDPRINGIKTKIRVVPDFPKKGNIFSSSSGIVIESLCFCFSLHALFRRLDNAGFLVWIFVIYFLADNNIWFRVFFDSSVCLLGLESFLVFDEVVIWWRTYLRKTWIIIVRIK